MPSLLRHGLARSHGVSVNRHMTLEEWQQMNAQLYGEPPWPSVDMGCKHDELVLVECPKCGAAIVFGNQRQHAEYHRTSDGGGL